MKSFFVTVNFDHQLSYRFFFYCMENEMAKKILFANGKNFS